MSVVVGILLIISLIAASFFGWSDREIDENRVAEVLKELLLLGVFAVILLLITIIF